MCNNKATYLLKQAGLSTFTLHLSLSLLVQEHCSLPSLSNTDILLPKRDVVRKWSPPPKSPRQWRSTAARSDATGRVASGRSAVLSAIL